MMIRRTTTLGQTSRVVRLESDENMLHLIRVSSALLVSRLSKVFSMFRAHESPVVSKQHTPSAQSLSDSESDIDAYGGSRRAFAAKKQQQRRLLQPKREITPAHGEVRFSTRRAAKVSNYNEEDDDDMFDDEADMVEQTNWPTAPEEDLPAIDAVLNHRLREDTSESETLLELRAETDFRADKDVTNPGRDDFEYFVSAIAPRDCITFCYIRTYH